MHFESLPETETSLKKLKQEELNLAHVCIKFARKSCVITLKGTFINSISLENRSESSVLEASIQNSLDFTEND